MPVSYLQALEIIDQVVQENSNIVNHDETVPLLAGIGRVTTRCVRSPNALPRFDTSAMDGYALSSDYTLAATSHHPSLFEVVGVVAAGVNPLPVQGTWLDAMPQCMEIMTGAQFPHVIDGPQMDACIPIEHTQLIENKANSRKYIKVVKPVCSNQHRRPAGSDIGKDQVVLPAGSHLRPRHLMSLAALGVKEVTVMGKIQIAVCVTGSEIVAYNSAHCLPGQIRDSNGPYIKQSLEASETVVTHYPPVPDNLPSLQDMLLQFQKSNDEVLITTGGVSAGKFDLLKDSLEEHGATIRFHKVAIRPGHPVLFATMESGRNNQSSTTLLVTDSHELHQNESQRNRSKAIFGLPGNPIAAAACLQFFVAPFLKRLSGSLFPKPIFAKVKHLNVNKQACRMESKDMSTRQIDIFRHGLLRLSRNGYEVIMNEDQASYKTHPIAQSNCWAWMPAFKAEPEIGDFLSCFPFSPIEDLNECSSHCSRRYRPSHTNQASRHKLPDNGVCSTRIKVLLLAGGLSTRMKIPKHLLYLDDHPLYQVILQQIYAAFPGVPNEDIYMSLRDDIQATELKQTHLIHTASLFPHQIITDLACIGQRPDSCHIGPASGLLSAYDKDSAATWLVIACDYPLVTSDALQQLINQHHWVGTSNEKANPAVTCFINNQNIYEPLLAIWTSEALYHLKVNVASGYYGPSKTVAHLMESGRCSLVKPREEEWVWNTNTPAEWEELLASRRRRSDTEAMSQS